MKLAPPAPIETTRRQPPRRVLIVDDDAAIRLLCSINLRSAGHDVLEANDGWIALVHARAEPPDLILTDITMPGLDGFELAQALLDDRRTSHVPVIFLSGETRVENETRARALGALAYVTKPFDPSALAALVNSAFAHHTGGPEPEPVAC